MFKSISFIIPAFNEEKNIESTVKTILLVAENQILNFEIIIINDASLDNTGEIISSLALADRRIIALHNPININLGGSYKRGLEQASKNYVLMLPGDNGYGVDSLNKIISQIGFSDILIPYPTNIQARTFMRGAASNGFTVLLNCIFGLKVKYFNGPVVHSLQLIKTINIKTNSFAYQAEALIKLLSAGYTYHECAVEIQARQDGTSSALKPKNLIAVGETITRLFFTIGLNRIFFKNPQRPS